MKKAGEGGTATSAHRVRRDINAYLTDLSMQQMLHGDLSNLTLPTEATPEKNVQNL